MLRFAGMPRDPRRLTPETASRREFLRAGTMLVASTATGAAAAKPGAPDPRPAGGLTAGLPHPLLTPADRFEDVSRGDPVPHKLQGEALVRARLTPETWRLEITADTAANEGSTERASVSKPLTLVDGTALDLERLLELGRKHAVRYLKAMQCLNIPTPLGQGLWEGVPLREVLRLCGRMTNVRRVYYSGFHNRDPEQLFQSSLSYTQAMETPPGELPAFVAYRLNGEPIPLERGGPVRMVIPWAHGFKSIKWLQRITLTNEFRANDTYAAANNDPESHLKSAAYLDEIPDSFPAGQPVHVGGLALCGLSGLSRVECWVRSNPGPPRDLPDDDPAWQSAQWTVAQIEPPPADWTTVLPASISPDTVLGFDPATGTPRTWPMRYSMISWSASLGTLPSGTYEVRARAVDLNGFAQPEPRPVQKTGKNAIQVRRFGVA
jgi:DMSO/TMAO reductase YedYZ molybdopterin-dependent catalytic subunit